MPTFDSTTLLGSYSTPLFTYGSVVLCQWRGAVEITGLTNARIPWPVGKRRGERGKTHVLYADLVTALKRESLAAVCYWWGVSDQTVTRWRRELGVGAMTEGTMKLKSTSAKASEALAAALKRGQAKNSDPERRRKISESKRGVPRPDHVIEAMRKGRTGKPHSTQARERMSAARRKRVTERGPDWTREEDLFLGEYPDEEVARKLSRSVGSVVARRKKLKIKPFGD